MYSTSAESSAFGPHTRGLKVLRIVGMAAIGIILACLFGLLFGFVVKLLWNWLMPLLFGFKTITYWQAFGLVLLAKLLFGGFGHGSKNNKSDHFHKKVDNKWHKWMGLPPHHEEHHDVSPEKWHRYHEFWEAEGKEAFNAYIERIKNDKKNDPDTEQGA